jgi:hypothetical protein
MLPEEPFTSPSKAPPLATSKDTIVRDNPVGWATRTLLGAALRTSPVPSGVSLCAAAGEATSHRSAPMPAWTPDDAFRRVVRRFDRFL